MASEEVIFKSQQSTSNISTISVPRYASLKLFAKMIMVTELELRNSFVATGRVRTTMINGIKYIDLDTQLAKALIAEANRNAMRERDKMRTE